MKFRNPAVCAALTVLVSPAWGDPAPMREGVGPGTPLTELIASGDCRMVIIGDSISNKNTNTALQSSYYWGIVRRWRPEAWAGICVPTNAQAPTIALTTPSANTATFTMRTLSALPGQRTFSYGYERISASATLDAVWFADAPAGQPFTGSRLLKGGAWRSGDWFDDVPMGATFVVLRSPEGLSAVQARSMRGQQAWIESAEFSLSGSVGVVGVDAPGLGAGMGECEFRLTASGVYDESALPNHLIWLTTRMYRTDRTGFQLDALAVGGSRLADWLANGPFATDERLREYFAATGYPNVFSIHLGANEAAFNETWAEKLRALIDRLDALSTANGVQPWFLLVPPYGTEQSISHAQALAAAAIGYETATSGTSRVAADRIGFINVPGLLGGPIGRSMLIDAIHPRPAGADMLASLLWEALTDEVFRETCIADMTGTSDPVNPLYGVPDGVADFEDLFYFLDAYATGDVSRADLTGSADPSDARYGVPDGVVDQHDLDYLVAAVMAGDAARGDLTGSADPVHPDYGRPNGIVDIDDFFYFLDQFVAGNLERADLSGSTEPSSPMYGVPDGLLDANDLFYFLDMFQEGCW
ncbi:MAG: SGNH/GDSL hydrolase family protein [Phycisphaeraceae bacterium]|nr:SGNH/GDSL hydrolase family protein [Phycisphaeraceae bacterium]